MPQTAAAKRESPKREHLLDTAWKLFYRHGYHAVGIDTILEEAGVAKMTLYNHFSSKEDLIVAVLQKRHHEIVHAITTAVEAAGTSPGKRLLAAFDWLENWINSGEFNGCAFIRAVAEFPRPDERPHQVAAAHKNSMIELVTGLCREAELKDAANLGRQLALLIEGAIVTAHTFGAGRVGKDTREAAKRLIAAAQH
jgi:AcrR family transcriptional regulator